jgi:hypothetical protein
VNQENRILKARSSSTIKPKNWDCVLFCNAPTSMMLITLFIHSLPTLFRIWTTAAIILGLFLLMGEARSLVPDLGDIEIAWNRSDESATALFDRHDSAGIFL